MDGYGQQLFSGCGVEMLLNWYNDPPDKLITRPRSVVRMKMDPVVTLRLSIHFFIC